MTKLEMFLIGLYATGKWNKKISHHDFIRNLSIESILIWSFCLFPSFVVIVGVLVGELMESFGSKWAKTPVQSPANPTLPKSMASLRSTATRLVVLVPPSRHILSFLVFVFWKLFLRCFCIWALSFFFFFFFCLISIDPPFLLLFLPFSYGVFDLETVVESYKKRWILFYSRESFWRKIR